uniref:RelA/SpoT domain-containing protein n=1 Tax=Corethron hystrix TaxID=216773 RepID=A0A7S1BM25_9STRA
MAGVAEGRGEGDGHIMSGRALGAGPAATTTALIWMPETGSEKRGRIRKRTGLAPPEVRAAREAIHVYGPLAERMGMHRLQTELEGTAFRILYKYQHGTITSLYREKGVGYGLNIMLQDMEGRLKRILKEDPTVQRYAGDTLVAARVKTPFSLWKKLLKQSRRGKAARDFDLLSVPDVLALRIIIEPRKMNPHELEASMQDRGTALCYYVQRLCMAQLPHRSIGRLKDYIATPKPNGYQSLHYSSMVERNGMDWPLEIQVRTAEMHHLAEFGIAAHWSYKRGPNPPGGDLATTRSHLATEETSTPALPLPTDPLREDVPAVEVLPAAPSPSVLDLEMDEDRVLDVILEGEGDDGSRWRAECRRARVRRLEPYVRALAEARGAPAWEEKCLVMVSFPGGGGEGRILSLPKRTTPREAVERALQPKLVEGEMMCLPMEWELVGAVLVNGRKVAVERVVPVEEEEGTRGDVLSSGDVVTVWLKGQDMEVGGIPSKCQFKHKNAAPAVALKGGTRACLSEKRLNRRLSKRGI